MYFRFIPYHRPMIWGSEEWLISAYPNMESRVSEGLYAGKTLSELTAILGPNLLGHALNDQYGERFPLLIKLIHAEDKLSIQVHPSDEQAQKQGKGSVGKTEMWYGLDSQEGAYLLVGLKNALTPQTYAEHVANHTIVNDIARYGLKEGSCFFLSPGRIHAIGEGCNLLEIQQTNDLTYRIYDYDRKDANGNLRELHTQLAGESINYTVLPDYETHYERKTNEPMNLVTCPYFETQAIQVNTLSPYSSTPLPPEIDWTNEDRFLAILITKGKGTLIIDGEMVEVKEEDALLLPATTKKVSMRGEFTAVMTTAR